jgi:hypothetical protein
MIAICRDHAANARALAGRPDGAAHAGGASQMGKVTCDMSMSVDGFVAGPNQSLAKPFGEGVGDRLHRWMFQEPEANAAEIQAVTAAGAFIMGRNMFGPGRDDWDLVEGTKPLPTGKVTVGFDFDHDGGGLHKARHRHPVRQRHQGR